MKQSSCPDTRPSLIALRLHPETFSSPRLVSLHSCRRFIVFSPTIMCISNLSFMISMQYPTLSRLACVAEWIGSCWRHCPFTHETAHWAGIRANFSKARSSKSCSDCRAPFYSRNVHRPGWSPLHPVLLPTLWTFPFRQSHKPTPLQGIRLGTHLPPTPLRVIRPGTHLPSTPLRVIRLATSWHHLPLSISPYRPIIISSLSWPFKTGRVKTRFYQ